MSGSVLNPGLQLESERISTNSLISSSGHEVKRLLFSHPNVFKRDGIEWEGICCAAFWMACNSGSVSGTPLSLVIARLASEFQLSERFIAFNFDENSLAFSALLSSTVPFISPYNSPWPKEVKELTGVNFANIERTLDNERIDGLVRSDALTIQLEMKTRGTSKDIVKALARIRIDSHVAFIFCKDSLVNASSGLDKWRSFYRFYPKNDVKNNDKKTNQDILLLRVKVDHETKTVYLEQYGPQPIPKNELEQSRTIVIIISEKDLNENSSSKRRKI